MAILKYTADGILSVTRDGEPEFYPPDVVHTLTIDETTNGDVLAAIGADWSAHRLEIVAGVVSLLRHGVVVVIAPPGPEQVAAQTRAVLRARAAARLDALRTIRDQADALAGVTTAWTQAQRQGVARALRVLADTELDTLRLAAQLLDGVD